MIIIKTAESLGGQEYILDTHKWPRKLVEILRSETFWNPADNKTYMAKVADILEGLIAVERINDQSEKAFVQDLIRLGVLEKVENYI